MTGKELEFSPRTAQQAVDKFQRTLLDLRGLPDFPEHSIGAHADNASKVAGLFETMPAIFYSPTTLTHFALAPDYLRDSAYSSELPYPEAGAYEPKLLLNIKKLQAAGRAHAEADIVRTATVISQYPDRGFERRFRSVYGEALQNQSDFLNMMDYPEIPGDPRHISNPHMLYGLMGQWKFAADTGFGDWQQAVDSWLNAAKRGNRRKNTELKPAIDPTNLCEQLFRGIEGSDDNKAIRRFLREVRDNIPNFLATREAKTPFVAKTIVPMPEYQALNEDPDKVAEVAANVLVQVSLLDFLADRRQPIAA